MRFFVVWGMGVLAAVAGLAAEDAAVTQRFRDLVAREWEYTLREAPTFAAHLGDKRYNDRWPDVSLPAIARRHTEPTVNQSRSGAATTSSDGDFRRCLGAESQT